MPYRARCFGLNWESAFPLPLFDTGPGDAGPADIVAQQVTDLTPRTGKAPSPQIVIDVQGFRFSWRSEAVFDMSGGEIIRCLPGVDWRGVVPHSFYGTVTAITLAWRGMLPLHASSVVVDGMAWLVAGRPGAGKSTTVAELLAAGGQLLADDLSVLRQLADGTWAATRGRPAMRLHAETAQRMRSRQVLSIPDDERGKLLASPHARAEDRDWPLGGLVVLGGSEDRAMSGTEVAMELGVMPFRPRISRALPNAADRMAALFDIAGRLPGWRLPSPVRFDPAACEDRCARLLDVIGRMRG